MNRLESLIKKSFVKILEKHNLFPSLATNVDDLLAFLRKVQPITTEAPLIRLGSTFDGGYLLPDDLNGISACFSPGVSFNSDFELDLANRGIKVYLADGSVNGPAKMHDLFKFEKKYLGVISGQNCFTLEDWVEDSLLEKESDLILQIDIEGFEYEVFLQATNSLLRRFRIIIVEFHNLESLFSKAWFDLASQAFMKLLQTHSVVHIHPNNCGGEIIRNNVRIPDAMEFTFYRNDRFNSVTKSLYFPHNLDSNNSINHPNIVLPSCWYQA